MLIVGLIIGGVGAYFYSSSTQTGHTTTLVSTQAVTQFSTITQSVTASQSVTSTSTTTTNTSGTSGPTAAMLQTALAGSQNATLGLSSYEFGKGSLVMWVTNNGTAPILLAPQFVIYNGTYQGSTYFTVLDSHVIQYGIYAYMPPGSEIIIQLSPDPPPVTPSVATVQILNNNFTFNYGTSKG